MLFGDEALQNQELNMLIIQAHVKKICLRQFFYFVNGEILAQTDFRSIALASSKTV